MATPHLGQRIRQLRREQRMSLRELGEAVGVSHSAVSKWESGASQVPSDDLGRIAAALKSTVADLYASPSGSQAEPASSRPAHPQDPISEVRFALARMERELQRLAARQPLVQVPVLGRVSASSLGGGLADARGVYIPHLDAERRTVFAVEVSGDCLEPETGISSGDTVVVDGDASPREGDLVAARLPDQDDYVVKYFYRRGAMVELRPDHGPPIVAPTDQVEIAGVVFGLWRTLGRRRAA